MWTNVFLGILCSILMGFGGDAGMLIGIVLAVWILIHFVLSRRNVEDEGDEPPDEEELELSERRPSESEAVFSLQNLLLIIFMV